jgi:hypothetical protein
MIDSCCRVAFTKHAGSVILSKFSAAVTTSAVPISAWSAWMKASVSAFSSVSVMVAGGFGGSGWVGKKRLID